VKAKVFQALVCAIPLVAPAVTGAVDASVGVGPIEEVIIIGTRSDARELPGSAWVIDAAELEVYHYTDIHRVLAPVPGVYAIDEEGLGLRPNIGIRGSGTERSGKITLAEDGILIAPAPYADPAAYYFPTTGRMSGIEILKGTPLLAQGPYTVGGAVNLLSTPLLEDSGGWLTSEYGRYDEGRLHTGVGDRGDTYGWLLETHQQRSDGFQTIDRSDRDTGLQKGDYVAKLQLNTPASFAGPYQQVDLKLAYADEESDSSYLGLTDADFDISPYRRYGLTKLDQMDNDWRGGTLGYTVKFRDSLSWNTVGYHNRFERDWFKSDRIGGASLNDVIDAANQGDSTAIAQLQGSADTLVDIKHNNRTYRSRGIQSRLNWDLAIGGIDHGVQFGARLHRDDIDRFQPVEQFNQIDGELVFVGEVAPIGSNNREESADARALWLLDTLGVTDSADLMLALRYEDIDTARTEYATPDRSMLAPADRQISNNTREWLPGAGLTWQLSDRWQWLAGVHRGMAPPGAGAIDGTDPEISVNYETGFRYGLSDLHVELIGFYSDYENSVRLCSVAFPCANGADSGSEQLGEAIIQGLEAAIEYRPQWVGLSWPLQLSYTYTDAEVTADSADGAVLDGDLYPYIPRDQLYVGVGVEAPAGWSLNTAARYVSAMCIDFECERPGTDNPFRKTDSVFVMDLAAGYQLSSVTRVYARVDNLFDSDFIVSRSPAGARVNKPRAAILGFTVQFSAES